MFALFPLLGDNYSLDFAKPCFVIPLSNTSRRNGPVLYFPLSGYLLLIPPPWSNKICHTWQILLLIKARRQTSYFSVFGKIKFRRPYFHTTGKAGICPLNAELSLPPNCYSYLLVDWANCCAVNEACDESINIIDRILGIKLSKQALESGVDMNASEVDRFYEQKPNPLPKDEGEIMVVQADGKGVPMKREEDSVKSARLGKGEKRGQKKEAVVTAIYTIEPHKRTPEDVLYALPV